MPSLSFERVWLDDLLSRKKQHTTRPETTRFEIGDIVHVYIEQRGKIIDKPIRVMTSIGTTAMADRVNNANYLYPATCPVVNKDHVNDLPSYYTHFIGKIEIVEIQNICPYEMSHSDLERWARADGFDNFAEAYKWFLIRYGDKWMDLTWTVIGWDGWIERYFESKRRS